MNERSRWKSGILAPGPALWATLLPRAAVLLRAQPEPVPRRLCVRAPCAVLLHTLVRGPAFSLAVAALSFLRHPELVACAAGRILALAQRAPRPLVAASSPNGVPEPSVCAS